MKKRILFILSVLDSGGVAKSLVSLLNVIDRNNYDVSLLLISQHKGPFYELLPKDIHIITDETLSAVGHISGLKYLLLNGKILLLLGTIIRLIVSTFSKAYSGYLLSRLMPAIDGEYDLIVDYNGQQQTYYMVDKLKASKKVSFFHSDYAKWPYYYRIDRKYYPKLDAIFTISDTCVKSLKQFFPEQTHKIFLMENISSLSLIDQLSHESCDWADSSSIKLLTIGHVTKSKGTDIAIAAAQILQSNGIDFNWYFLGNNSAAAEFEILAQQLNVSSRIHFLGIKSNPYPYIKATDIVVHPSLFEGKSIALDEAKLLCKPIVVTNFSTVQDQFTHGVNAEIVEMNPRAVANGILELLNKPHKREGYINWLHDHRTDNSSEINKIYALLNQ